MGPGTEMKKLLISIGITIHLGCRCKEMMKNMDVWGVEGCKQKKDQIIMVMEESAELYSWKDYVVAATLSALVLNVQVIGFKINPLNPFPGLVDIAIYRAESPTVSVRRA